MPSGAEQSGPRGPVRWVSQYDGVVKIKMLEETYEVFPETHFEMRVKTIRTMGRALHSSTPRGHRIKHYDLTQPPILCATILMIFVLISDTGRAVVQSPGL
jgi:hypothetical protein